MEVFGMRSNAGIWWDDTRRSFKGVSGAFDVAIVEVKLKRVKGARMEIVWLINREQNHKEA